MLRTLISALTRALMIAIYLATGCASQGSAETADPKVQKVFVLALELIGTGDYQAAIRLLRSMLRDDPSLHRVRLELARTYFLAEEWERSRREFFTVLSADIPDQVRANVIAFLRAIDARRGWDWGLNFAIVSGPGLSRHYRTDAVTLEIGGQELEFNIDRPETPDFGVEYGGYLEARKALSKDVANEPQITGGFRASVAVQDFEGSTYDDHRLRLEAPLTIAYPARTFEIGPFGNYRWYGGEPFESEFGFQGQIADRSVKNWTLTLAALASRIDNLDDPDRDGTRLSAVAGAFRSIGGTTIAGASLGLQRLDAAQGFESYNEYHAGLLISSDLGYGLTATFRPNAAWQQFDENAPLFRETRHDWEVRAFFQVTKADFTLLGFSPFLSYEFAWHGSNIDMYQYTDNIVQIGFTKAF